MKNQITTKLTEKVYEKARTDKSKFWWVIAKELEKSRRTRPEVNLYKLSKVTKDGETVLVPGKVLGTGTLDHKLNVIALSFSATALEKLGKMAVTLSDLVDSGKTPKAVRIIK